MDHISQYYLKCDHRKKIDFLADILGDISAVRTFIFFNTKDFLEITFNILKKKGFKVNILFSKMTKEERDEVMLKFVKGEINVILTTNLLARGIDVPETTLVINFDVPRINVNGVPTAEPETFMHRIGRAGRFGVLKGIALTIYDNPTDEKIFNEIIEHYKMTDKV